MKKEAVVSLDIGGTSIDAACVSESGEILGGITEIESPSNKSAEEIIDTIAQFITATRESVSDYDVHACGIGMPGPFDYGAGVSHMEHKFAAINGLDLRKALAERTGLAIYFINDADAFGVGVAWQQLPQAKRIIALTIGTGLGSSFIENGASLVSDARIPEGSEVWNLAYKNGILEDVVSGRGIRGLYEMKTGKSLYPLEIEDLARRGDEDAAAVFHEVGVALGHVLLPIYSSFQPEKIVVGGKIGRATDLFGPVVEQILNMTNLHEPFVIRAEGENLAIIGVARYALAQIR